MLSVVLFVPDGAPIYLRPISAILTKKYDVPYKGFAHGWNSATRSRECNPIANILM